MNDDKLPVLFVSHGSPMLGLDSDNSAILQDWGWNLPKPQAVLTFSAHWEMSTLAFGETIRHSELVYDFSGFPPELYDIKYPAPGAADLAKHIQSLLREKHSIEFQARGLDHAVWLPFHQLWPMADIPVLQMALPKSFSNQQLFELGEALSVLRTEGVMITGNGTLTHNLREWFQKRNNQLPEFALAFDQWVKQALESNDLESLLNWETHGPRARENHPTPEHFRPLLITLGASKGDQVSFPIEGFEYDIFSKRSVQFG